MPSLGAVLACALALTPMLVLHDARVPAAAEDDARMPEASAGAASVHFYNVETAREGSCDDPDLAEDDAEFCALVRRG